MTTQSLESKFRIDPLAIFKQTASEPRSDKRRSKRVPYEATIQVAPYNGRRTPSSNLFEEVITRDLSATGISFFQTGEPTSEQVVLRLGSDTNPQHLIAKVVRFQEGYFLRKRQFLVGCQFVGRIDLANE